MDINEYLKKIAEEDCSCGKKHEFTIGNIIVESGAVKKVAKSVKDLGGSKAFVLSDKNTYAVAGKTVCEVLTAKKIPFVSYVFNEDSLEPDERAVGSAIMHYSPSCDVVISVGSGVINDIGKIVAATANKPYIIVGTAPSMDGYASATSSMSMDGLKVSLPSKCADVIIGDIDILKNAPIHMLQAGIGDMLAKYISIAEWRIAHEITGEYYCEKIATLIRTALKRCVDNAAGLLSRDEDAIKAVFEGLVIGGVAMAFAGVSRPASGVEHYFSHVWDMRGLEFGTKVALHGTQCAVATLIAAELYERVLKLCPNKRKALSYVSEFDFNEWAKELKAFLGKGADAMILGEQKEKKYDLDKHAKRLEIILSKWDKILDIIRQEIPSKSSLEKIFERIGAPKTALEIGVDCDSNVTFKATKDIRDKYVLSRLLWDLGVIEEFKI